MNTHTKENLCPCCGRPVALCMAVEMPGTVTAIIRDSAAAWDVTAGQLTGEGRSSTVTAARHLACALIREAIVPTPTFDEIARAIGRKDGGSACYGCRVVRESTGRKKRLFNALLPNYQSATPTT